MIKMLQNCQLLNTRKLQTLDAARYCVQSFIFCTLLCLPVTAVYAQDCENLGENTEWTALFQQMNTQAQAEDYEMALNTFKKMSDICSIVPSANYSAGMIHKKLKNYKEAYGFLMVATRHTKQFAVDEDLMKRMWYALYETEYPAVIDFRSGKVEQLHQEALAAKDALLAAEKQEKLEFAETMMWTGAGIGIAGVVLAAVGGGLMAMNGDEIKGNYIDDRGVVTMNPWDNKNYMSGTILLGLGTSAAIAGAIMTGIAGYKYTKYKYENAEIENTLAFHIDYNKVSLSLQF
jgi:tetratricopeptide (TPR) repeat protein